MSASRLSTSISKEHDKAEILISWVQLFFTVGIFTVYLLAPKAHDSDLSFQPVPIVLGLYLPFVLLRIYWAKRRLLNEAMLYLYCFFDTVMITGLIYSFHIQYQSPLTVVFKAPTFLYLIVFICLRVLRHDIKYLVAMGVFSIISIGGLLFAALMNSEIDITRNFVEYATSDKLLLGVEVEKIIAIAIITTVLGFAVHRNQRMLAKSVRDTQARKDFSRFFSPEVAENITESQDRIAPGTGKVRAAAILNVDIRGFTKYSARHSPAEIMTLLSEYQKRMLQVILQHGGSVDKFMGDGILAHFGAAKKSNSFAADCMSCIDDLVRVMDLWNGERESEDKDQLQFGISAAVGEVMFGAVGDESRLEFTIIGDSVNLAAKLEKHSKAVNALAISTKKSIEIAYKQGYLHRGNPPVDRLKSTVEGLGHPIDLVILHKQRQIKPESKQAMKAAV